MTARKRLEAWWMIERDDLEPRPHYFAWAYRPGQLPKTQPHGSHYWTPDWAKGEQFATKEDAEAHTNGDPLLHVRSHCMMQPRGAVEELALALSAADKADEPFAMVRSTDLRTVLDALKLVPVRNLGPSVSTGKRDPV